MISRRTVCILACVLCAAGTLFAGGGAEADRKPAAAAPVTITYWQHSSAARDTMMKALAYEFMQANPGISVKMEFIPEADYSTKLVSSLATSTGPDVMQVESGMIKRLVNAGALQALDPAVLSADRISSEFTPATVDTLQVGGKYYGLPTDMQTIVLYWNKDLVAAEGLDAEKGPQSWDEFLDWAKKLTKRDGDKMVQSGWGENGYHPEVQAFVVQNGGKMVDKDGRYCFADDPKSAEAIQWVVDAYRKHKVFETKFVSRWAGFRQGKVALMLGHPAMLGNLKQTAPNVKLGIGLIPARAGRHTTIVTSWAYVMAKKAPSSAATKWVEYLTSADVEKRWTLSTGELPARKALLTDESLVKDPQLKILLSSLSDSSGGYLQMGILNSIWATGFEKLILSDEPFSAVLKDMQDNLNKEVAKDSAK